MSGLLAGLLAGTAAWLSGWAGRGARLARLRELTPPRSAPGRPGRGPGRWRASRPPEPVPVPMILDLCAAVLASGAPPATALRLVGESLPDPGAALAAELARAAARLDAGAGSATPEQSPLRPLLEALDLATATGLGPVSLVQVAAERHRRRQAAAGALAARRLAVLVVLPTGLCLLPAFVLLSVAPLVLALLTGI